MEILGKSDLDGMLLQTDFAFLPGESSDDCVPFPGRHRRDWPTGEPRVASEVRKVYFIVRSVLPLEAALMLFFESQRVMEFPIPYAKGASRNTKEKCHTRKFVSCKVCRPFETSIRL